MNEELLRLAYSKMKTDASFETFVQDFKSSVDLQNLAYSKMKTDASFETFVQDALGSVKKKEPTAQGQMAQEPTAQEQMAEAMAPKQGGLDFVSEDSSLDLSTQQGRDEAYKESQDFELQKDEELRTKLAEQTYTYAGRPGAKYKKQPDGSYLINLGDKTQNNYIPLDDPDGTRTAELNRNAISDITRFQKSEGPYGSWTKILSGQEIEDVELQADKEKKAVISYLDKIKEDQFEGAEELSRESFIKSDEIKNKLIKDKESKPITDINLSKRYDRVIAGLDTDTEEYKENQRIRSNVKKLNEFNDVKFKKDQSETEYVTQLSNFLKSLPGPESDIFTIEESSAGTDEVKITNKLTGESKRIDLDAGDKYSRFREKELASTFVELSIKSYKEDKAVKDYYDAVKFGLLSDDITAFTEERVVGGSPVTSVLESIFGSPKGGFEEKEKQLTKEAISNIPLDYNFEGLTPEAKEGIIEAREKMLSVIGEKDKIVKYDPRLLPAYNTKENIYLKNKQIVNKRKTINQLNEEADNIVGQINEVDASIALGRQPQALQFETVLGPMSNLDKRNYLVNQLKTKVNALNEEQQSLQDIEINLNQSAAVNFAIQEKRGSTLGAMTKSFLSGGAGFAGFVMGDTEKDIYGQTYEQRATEDLVPGIITDEYIASKDRSDLFKAGTGLLSSIGAMATGSLIAPGVGTVASKITQEGFKRTGAALRGLPSSAGIYGMLYSENKNLMSSPEFDDIPEWEKKTMSALYAGVSTLLEKLGLSRAFSKTPLGKTLTAKIINKTFSEIPKGASAKVISNTINKNAKSTLNERLLGLATAPLAEGGTEAAQELYNVALKNSYNAIKGKDYFEVASTYNAIYDVTSEAFKLGVIGGAMANTAGQATRAVAEGFNEKTRLNDVDFKVMYDFATKGDMYSTYEAQLNTQVALGKMTEKDAQSKLDGIGYAKGIFDQIPDNLNTSDAKEAFNLIVEKRNLESKVEGKEPNLVVKEKERITEIDNELTELGKKEVVAEEVAEPTVAEEIIAEEVVGEEVVGEEVVAEEVAEPTVAEEVVAEEDVTPRRKAETFSFDNLAEQPLDVLEEKLEESKVDIQNIEEGTVEYDAETTRIKALETEIETANQEQQELDDFRKMISEEFTEPTISEEGVTSEDVTIEEQNDIDSLFKKGQNITLNRSKDGSKNTNPLRDNVVNISKLAAKSISKVLPNVKIILHETNEDYLKYAKLGDGRAEYNHNNTTIHVNLSKATKTTVPHEIFHAVLMDKIKSDPDIAIASEKMVSSVLKVLPKDSDISKRIEAFAKSYEGELQNEERLAELVGILSSEYRQLNRPSKNIIVDFLKSIAKKFGIKLGSDFGAKDSDVVDLLNVISRKTRTGEVIEESDIQTLEKEGQDSKVTEEVKVSSRQQLADELIKTASKASSVELFSNPNSLNPKRMDNGRTKVIELGRAFDKRAKEEGFYIPLPKDGKYTDTQLNQIAEAMTDDAELQLKEDDSGIGWYDLKTKSAMELMSRIHPELSDSDSKPHLEFTLLVALISQNNSVGINFRQANEAYTYYKNNNKLPDRKYAGKSGNIIKQNIALSFEIIKKKGWKNYKNKLQETKTVKEWEAEGYKINGENKTTKITGAMAMLGSKIGSFWGNLNGDFDTLTADLWFSRMFNRYTGNVVAKDKTEGSKKNTLSAIESYKGSDLLYGFNKAELLKGGKAFDKWLNTITKNYANGGYKSKIPLNIVANTHFKNLSGSLQDIPRGGNERNTMRDVVKKVQDKLIERGFPKLDIADIQAIVWYNEKDLYRLYKAVNKSSEKTDYETAAQEVLREQGVNSEVALQFKRSKSSTDGGRDKTDSVQSKGVSSEVTTPTSREQVDDTQSKPKQRQQKVMSMSSIISKGRENGISDESIKIILKERGFNAKDINQALEVSIDLFTSLPKEFANVEGGAIVGEKLFNEIKTALNKFAKSKTMSEVRQKAQELLKDNPIYKIQDEQVKLELENSLDRKLGIRKNKNVTKEIAEVRRRIKDMKEAGKSIASIQRLMRSAIRTLLPKSDNYTNANIVKLIKIVNDTKRPSEVEGQMMKVLNEVEKAREKIKNNLIDKISVIVKKKAKFKRTESGKRRGKGLDSYGQSYFSSVKKVLDLVKAKDVDGLSKFIEDNNKKYEEALEKLSNNEKLNLEYQTALDNQLAIDSFSDLMSMDLEQVEVILEEVKIARKESIARLNNRRQLRQEKANAIKEKFNKQISEDFDVLFDEDGEPLSKNRLNRRKDNVNKSISETGLFNRVKNFLGTFRQEQKLKGNGYIRFIRNNVDHFGTITRILDRNKEGMFVKTFYERLNVLIEDASKGRRNTTRKIDAMTESIFNKDWKKWKRSLKSKESKDFKAKDVKTKKEYKLTLNKNQAMRIYALSLNEVQRKKIEAQGINIEEIKTFIGQENKALVDQVVDFLSNQYFDEINDVYVQANDINLGYVDNYFPTKTVSSGADMVDFFKGDFSKQFNAEYGMTALSERMDMNSEVDLSQQIDFTSVLDNHVKSMEKYKAYALDVKQMNSILKDKSIQNLLDVSGMKVLFDEMLSYSINPEAGPNVSDDIVNKVQRKYTGYALAFKAIQVVKQASSVIYAYPDYQPGPVLKNIPGGRLIGLALDYSGVIGTLPRQIREAREMSAGFDERVTSGLEGDIQSIESGGRIAELPVRRLKRMWRKAAGLATAFGDILGILGYKAVYNRNIKNGMSKAEALRMFNNYNTTQQTKRPTEKGGLQRSVNPGDRALTMFGSSMFLMMNNVAQSGNAMVTSIADGKPPKSKDIKKFLVNYSAGNVLFTLASYSPALLFGDDDENEAAYEALFKAATGLNIAFYIPFIGTGLEYAYNTATGKRNPLSDTVNPFLSLVKDMSRIYKDLDESESIVYSVLPIAEIMVGAQLDAPIALYELLGEGDYSEENMYDLIGVSKSYRPGYGKTSSSDPVREFRKELLEGTGYTSETKLKEEDPAAWRKTFGKAKNIIKMEKLKREAAKEKRKAAREERKNK